MSIFSVEMGNASSENLVEPTLVEPILHVIEEKPYKQIAWDDLVNMIESFPLLISRIEYLEKKLNNEKE